MSHDDDLVTRLREYLASGHFRLNGRLPAERDLARQLGVSRTALRKALAVLDAEGQVWRHVGRGTFVGARPAADPDGVASISARTNPAEVMEARLLFEPELARLAALNATPADLAEMLRCIRQSRAARDWRVYETWDTRLHRTIAQATGNALLLSMFDSLNAVRRAVAWGRLRTYDTPARDHHSFAEHDAIVAAIEDRDRAAAARCMREHLQTVRDRLLETPVAAE